MTELHTLPLSPPFLHIPLIIYQIRLWDRSKYSATNRHYRQKREYVCLFGGEEGESRCPRQQQFPRVACKERHRSSTQKQKLIKSSVGMLHSLSCRSLKETIYKQYIRSYKIFNRYRLQLYKSSNLVYFLFLFFVVCMYIIYIQILNCHLRNDSVTPTT